MDILVAAVDCFRQAEAGQCGGGGGEGGGRVSVEGGEGCRGAFGGLRLNAGVLVYMRAHAC